jgi:hypothetical protein
MLKIILIILTAMTLATAGVFTAVASGAVPDATVLKVGQAVQQVFAPQSARAPVQAEVAVSAAANDSGVPGMPPGWPTEWPTGWPTGWPTEFPTGFPTGVWTPVPYPTANPCGGPYAQDKAAAIAQELTTLTGSTVTAQEILDLLCQGYKGPEIVAAYLISHDKGVPVAEVLAMRDSGKTWQEILSFYGLVQIPTRPARPAITIPPNVTLPARPGGPNPGGNWPRPRP